MYHAWICREKNGKVECVFCNHDGHVYHVGSTLIAHYNTLDSIDKLFALGDLEALGRSPERCVTLREIGEEQKIVESISEIPNCYHSYFLKNGIWLYRKAHSDTFGLIETELLKQRPTRISAEIHTDDFMYGTEFNAIPWFEEASSEQVAELRKHNWKTNDTGGFFHAEDPLIATMKRYSDSHGIGYEVSVNEDEALTWIDTFRPALASLLKHDISMR